MCTSDDMTFDLNDMKPCFALLVQTGAHALIFLLGTIRLMQMWCSSSRPRPHKMRTTGELCRLIKIMVSVTLSVLSVLVYLGESWAGFDHLNDFVNGKQGLVLIDVGVRFFSWLYCAVLLMLAQHHQLKESVLLCIWWFLVLVASVPLLLVKDPDASPYLKYQLPTGFMYFSFGLCVIVNISMACQTRYTLKGKRKPLIRKDAGELPLTQSRYLSTLQTAVFYLVCVVSALIAMYIGCQARAYPRSPGFSPEIQGVAPRHPGVCCYLLYYLHMHCPARFL